MSKIIFITGGARSGKSRFAVETAKKKGKKVVFIATAEVLDDEMKERVRRHKMSRPREWGLIEEALDLGRVISSAKKVYDTAIVDCIGLWMTNLLMTGMKDAEIEKKINALPVVISKSGSGAVILVSNEVGQGIVPADLLSRRFRDLVGTANQVLASYAEEVFIMQSGIPVRIK